MRLLIIVYDQGIDESMSELIDRLDLTGWTKSFGALGVGGTGRKMNDAVWPGANNVLYIHVDEEQAAIVVDAIHTMQSHYRLRPGITIWSVAAEAL